MRARAPRDGLVDRPRCRPPPGATGRCSTARRRPAAPYAARRAGSASSRRSAGGQPAGRRGGTSSPVTPGTTVSSRPPTARADDGAAAGHRLDGHDAERLVPRHGDHDVAPSIRAGTSPAGHAAEEADPVGDAAARGELAAAVAPRGRRRAASAAGPPATTSSASGSAASASIDVADALALDEPADRPAAGACGRPGGTGPAGTGRRRRRRGSRWPGRQAGQSRAARPPRRCRWRSPGRPRGTAVARGRSATGGLVSAAALVAALDRCRARGRSAARGRRCRGRPAELASPLIQKWACTTSTGGSAQRWRRRVAELAACSGSSSSLGTSDGGPGRHVLDDVAVGARRPGGHARGVPAGVDRDLVARGGQPAGQGGDVHVLAAGVDAAQRRQAGWRARRPARSS